MPQWTFPVDPECPEVEEYTRVLFDDPMTVAYGAPTGEIMEAFERKHRAKCKRCQEFACANVGVE